MTPDLLPQITSITLCSANHPELIETVDLILKGYNSMDNIHCLPVHTQKPSV